jgi:hypothetical protein
VRAERSPGGARALPFRAFARHAVTAREGGAVPLTIDQLEEVVVELLTRPGHEKVRTLVSKLLTDGLEAKFGYISFEHQTMIVRGRIDALLGRANPRTRRVVA